MSDLGLKSICIITTIILAGLLIDQLLQLLQNLFYKRRK
jgi:hypothetical protein